MTTTLKKLLILTIFLGLGLGQAIAQSWYNANWQYRKEITIDYTKVDATGAPHTNFPVLISLTSDTDLSSNAQADGDDILFTSSDGTTKLDYDRESYASGTLVAWVEIPSLSATANTVIYLYYGYASAADQQAKTATWNSNYKGVWHLAESSGIRYDATSSDNDLSISGTVSSSSNGKFDGAADFEVSTEGSLVIADNASLSITGNLTLSGWVKLESLPSVVGDQMAIASKSGSSVCYHLFIEESVTNGATDVGRFKTSPNGSSHVDADGDSPMSAATWYYLNAVYNGTDMRVYLNGSLDASADNPSTHSTGNYDASTQFSIGRRADNADEMDGLIDEVRISNTAHSAGWILTEYNNQNSPGTFYSVGSQTLPVELLFFKAEKIDEKGFLTWATASEKDNDFFTIEKSLDGREFDDIGTVKGGGNSLRVIHYSFTDEELLAGTNYYRLKQTDFDGESSHSQIVMLDASESHGISRIFPIPASDIVTLEIEAMGNETGQIQLFDMAGLNLYNETIAVQRGINRHEINTMKYSTGLYIISYTNGQRAVNQKITIVH